MFDLGQICPYDEGVRNDGAYSLMVKLRSVAAAIRVQFPLGTQKSFEDRPGQCTKSYDTIEECFL